MNLRQFSNYVCQRIPQNLSLNIIADHYLCEKAIFVGSTQIDDAFAELFKKKLQDKRNEQPDRFRDFVVDEHAPQDVARGYRFQAIKLSCGTGHGIPKHAHQQMIFSVPGLPDSESAGVPG